MLLALGTLKNNERNYEFSKSHNVENGLDFLLRVNEYKSKYIGKNVVVIGGGYTSMDCARTALRLGAKTVRTFYRRTTNDLIILPGELEELINEHGKMIFNAQPIKLIEKNNLYIDFKGKIQNNLKYKKFSIIAEIKKASPSAGILIKDFNHLDIAKIYVDNGATCLSVLTEEKNFLGKLDYIKDIKDNFKIPILAKDFFIDPYQVALSKSYGCDCILIIIAALDKKLADEIYAEALKHNLSVIVEVHNEKEADTALKYDQALIGINNRNLKTLDISINNTISMFEILKNHKGPLISESGIKDEKDAKYIYEKTGIKNFLIGESLLQSDNTAELMKRLTQIIK